MPFSVGPMELVIVLAIALIVLGPKRLPDAGRSLGRGLREFKGAISGAGDEERAPESERPAEVREVA
jgi:sec-independent protein translocase protein TatA